MMRVKHESSGWTGNTKGMKATQFEEKNRCGEKNVDHIQYERKNSETSIYIM